MICIGESGLMRVTRGSQQFVLKEDRYHLADGKHDSFLWGSRIKFLTAIQRLAPEVLVALRDVVLSEFQRNPQVRDCLITGISPEEYLRFLRDRGLEDEIIHPRLTPQGLLAGLGASVVAWPTVQAAAEDLCPELMPTVKKLMGWAQHFCLTHVEKSSGLRVPPEWVLNAAWGTITAWDRFADLKAAMSWHPPSLILPPLETSSGRWKLTLHFASYDPLVQTWEEYERSFRSYVSSETRSFLERHKSKIDDEFRDWKRRPNKWREEHFEWLVLFQIKGRSPGQIADGSTPPVTEIAVLKGVHRAASIIGLSTRPGKRGRGAIGNMNSPRTWRNFQAHIMVSLCVPRSVIAAAVMQAATEVAPSIQRHRERAGTPQVCPAAAAIQSRSSIPNRVVRGTPPADPRFSSRAEG
jgi:hypothetical protein